MGIDDGYIHTISNNTTSYIQAYHSYQYIVNIINYTVLILTALETCIVPIVRLLSA